MSQTEWSQNNRPLTLTDTYGDLIEYCKQITPLGFRQLIRFKK